MRTHSSTIRFWLFLCISLAGTFVLAGQAHSTWQAIHGHSGHVETEANLSSPVIHLGWGLDIHQTPGSTNWVHFAVPSPGAHSQNEHGYNEGARYVKIRFQTFSQASVSAVHIYNGGNKIAEFPGSWSGMNTLMLDLGSVRSFPYGLGISVNIEAEGKLIQPDAGRIIFYGVGAEFVNIPAK